MKDKSTDRLAPFHVFMARVRTGTFMAGSMLAVSLLIGILGYHYICSLGWVDSLLNSSMILTGMGPVNPMTDNAAKIFASIYAIFSGVVFLTTIAVMLAPVVHRAFHKFHIDDEAEERGF
jgi:hypothetical protein